MKAPFSTEPARLEAFSDGVMAVIITIMVLELRPPHGTNLASLHVVLPTLVAYAMSFVFIGIYSSSSQSCGSYPTAASSARSQIASRAASEQAYSE